LPVMSLDGDRGFRALGKQQRLIAAGVILAAWFATAENMLLLLLIVAGFRAFAARAPEPGHRGTLVTYSVLIIALSWLATLEVGIEPKTEPAGAVADISHAPRSTLLR
jgi:hypothetical protein